MPNLDVAIKDWKHHQPVKVELGFTREDFIQDLNTLKVSTKVSRESIARFENDNTYAVAYIVYPTLKEGHLSTFWNERKLSNEVLENSKEIIETLVKIQAEELYHIFCNDYESLDGVTNEEVEKLLNLEHTLKNHKFLDDNYHLWIFAYKIIEENE